MLINNTFWLHINRIELTVFQVTFQFVIVGIGALHITMRFKAVILLKVQFPGFWPGQQERFREDVVECEPLQFQF